MEQNSNQLPRYAETPENVKGYSEVYKPGGPAYLGGQEITEQLKDCDICPRCGIYGRKNLVRPDGCFRCNPLRRLAQRQSVPPVDWAAVVVCAGVFLFGFAVGALAALIIR